MKETNSTDGAPYTVRDFDLDAAIERVVWSVYGSAVACGCDALQALTLARQCVKPARAELQRLRDCERLRGGVAEDDPTFPYRLAMHEAIDHEVGRLFDAQAEPPK